ncbi:MAG: hypothetical protein COA78_26690 [Blastopirellula sp.]|nr:MAG: hypothetical protein COA78_26690 [Blastopirellula sp.]
MVVGEIIKLSFALTFAFVQCSLLGTWAILGRGPYWIRTPLGFLSLIWIEYALIRVMTHWQNNPAVLVPLTIMMFLQFVCIAGMIFLIQLCLKLLKMETYLETNTRFSLGTLLIFTSLIAVALGAGKIVVEHFGITLAMLSASGENFWILPFIGVFNGLSVVLMLPPLWCHRWQLKLILALPLLIMACATGAIEQYLFELWFSENSPWFLFPTINLGQALLFYITVFPLWRWKAQAKEEKQAAVGDDLLNEELEGVTV